MTIPSLEFYRLNKEMVIQIVWGETFRFGASEAAHLTLEGPLFRKNKDKPAKTTLFVQLEEVIYSFF